MEQGKIILLIDDDRDMHIICKKYIENAGYMFISAYSGSEGLKKVIENHIDLILLDFMMPEMNGAEVFNELITNETYKDFREIPVVMLTVLSENYLQQKKMLKMGIRMYLKKPFGYHELVNVIENIFVTSAIELTKKKQEFESADHLKRLEFENRRLRTQIQETYNFQNIIGSNQQMKDILEKVAKVARTDANVFIYGENGTGKELIARTIHSMSRRKNNAFVPVDCMALPSDLLERELFGCENTAFGAAPAPKTGMLELADKGALFLEDICEMNCDLQAKLLRVLQEHQYRKSGKSQVIDVDIRIISTSRKPPETAVAENKLREDLYYRLNVIPLYLPPLRERKDDIELLIHYFIKKFCAANASGCIKIDAEAMSYLTNYHWPGNVRELQNVVERVVALTSNKHVHPDDLPDHVLNNSEISSFLPSPEMSLKDARRKWMEKFERNYLIELLHKCNGNISEVARAAQSNRMTIYRMIKNYNISTRKFNKKS
ncbi:sigma-54-dependent Fis family transcriptional regulator [candidate division KSB1 bacterium]|nr:sigma-54-dependent Fis family transcriptional regulator [candidate division KSB1 bacterium]